MNTAVIKNTERIAARVPPEIFDTLCRAAELCGATVNQFLIQASLKEAQAVIDREQVIKLSRRDADQLLALLEHPPAPNATLLAAQAHYLQNKRDADSGFNWHP